MTRWNEPGPRERWDALHKHIDPTVSLKSDAQLKPFRRDYITEKNQMPLSRLNVAALTANDCPHPLPPTFSCFHDGFAVSAPGACFAGQMSPDVPRSLSAVSRSVGQV